MKYNSKKPFPKGPGDLWGSDDYEEMPEADYGRCYECSRCITLEQVGKTQKLVPEKHHFDEEEVETGYWELVPQGICKECLDDLYGNEK